MQSALRMTTWVLPGGRIEIMDAQLPDGNPVDLIVLLPEPYAPLRRSIVDVLAEAPGHLVFQNVEDVDSYLREERDSWDR